MLPGEPAREAFPVHNLESLLHAGDSGAGNGWAAKAGGCSTSWQSPAAAIHPKAVAWMPFPAAVSPEGGLNDCPRVPGHGLVSLKPEAAVHTMPVHTPSGQADLCGDEWGSA